MIKLADKLRGISDHSKSEEDERLSRRTKRKVVKLLKQKAKNSSYQHTVYFTDGEPIMTGALIDWLKSEGFKVDLFLGKNIEDSYHVISWAQKETKWLTSKNC